MTGIQVGGWQGEGDNAIITSKNKISFKTMVRKGKLKGTVWGGGEGGKGGRKGREEGGRRGPKRKGREET